MAEWYYWGKYWYHVFIFKFLILINLTIYRNNEPFNENKT